MKNLTLKGQWLVKAPLDAVFATITNFEKFPELFPKVAESIQVKKREGNNLEIEAMVRSFGRLFPVQMKTQILLNRGFISDNVSAKFGTSGHEELLLSSVAEGTQIDYTYQVTIHKTWLRVVAGPLIRGYSMKFWKKAVIDRLRIMLEK